MCRKYFRLALPSLPPHNVSFFEEFFVRNTLNRCIHAYTRNTFTYIHIDYIIESATYGFLFTDICSGLDLAVDVSI